MTEPTGVRALADSILLGERPASAFPPVDGYDLTYLRPGATLGAVTVDEYGAPVLAFWHRGLGRVAALTAEVDGKYSGRLNAWSDFAPFSIGLARWLLGGDPPAGSRPRSNGRDRRASSASSSTPIVRGMHPPPRARLSR